LPTTPDFKIGDTEFLGSSEKDTSKVEIFKADEKTIKFNFKIAEGSEIYSGSTEPGEIAGSRLGDIYIDSELGKIYKLVSTEEGAKKWQIQEGTIKGPVGSSLRVVK
jgi:hypothetical protein